MLEIISLLIIFIGGILCWFKVDYFTEEQKHIERLFFSEKLDKSDEEYWNKYWDSLKGG